MRAHCLSGSASRSGGTLPRPPPLPPVPWPPAAAASGAAAAAGPEVETEDTWRPRLLSWRGRRAASRPPPPDCRPAASQLAASPPRLRGVKLPSAMSDRSCGVAGSMTSEVVRLRGSGLVASCSVRSFLPSCRQGAGGKARQGVYELCKRWQDVCWQRADLASGKATSGSCQGRPAASHVFSPRTDHQQAFPALCKLPTCAVAESMLTHCMSSSVMSEGGSRRRLPGDGGRSTPRACRGGAVVDPQQAPVEWPRAVATDTAPVSASQRHTCCFPVCLFGTPTSQQPTHLLAQPRVGAGGAVAVLARRLAPRAARAVAAGAAGARGQ